MSWLYTIALIIAIIGAFVLLRSVFKAGYNKRKAEDLDREKHTTEKISHIVNVVDNLPNDSVAGILQNITDKHAGNMSNKA